MAPWKDLAYHAAVLSLFGGVGGVVGIFLLFDGLGGWRGLTLTLEDLNGARWGFVFGGVPGLLLGLIRGSQPVSPSLTSKLSFLTVVSFVLGIASCMLIMVVLLMNSDL